MCLCVCIECIDRTKMKSVASFSCVFVYIWLMGTAIEFHFYFYSVLLSLDARTHTLLYFVLVENANNNRFNCETEFNRFI